LWLGGGKSAEQVAIEPDNLQPSINDNGATNAASTGNLFFRLKHP
jgi:hypothetical protein